MVDLTLNIKDAFIYEEAEKLEQVKEIPSELYAKYNVKRGLRNKNNTGVVVGLTRVGEVIGYDVDENKNKIPKEGKLYYRGYDIEDLVANCEKENRFGFEEVAYLLLFGELPTAKKLETFNALLDENRDISMDFATKTILTTPSKSIMNKLQRAILTMYSYDDNADSTEISNVIRQSIELLGSFPTMVAYAYQAQQSFFYNKSLHLHYPERGGSTAENILRLIRPTGEYSDLEAKILDLCLIVHAEHGGGNNSSFTTHLVSSSGTDTYAAISAAIGALKGPKHGGANIAAINMIRDLKQNVTDITDYAQVDDYLARVLRGRANDGSGLVYGMGHAIYTLSDPRAKLLKEMARKLAQDKDKMESFLLCDYIEKRTPELRAEITGNDKPMCANVDLYSGFVYEALGIPTEIATPLFAVARLSGWCAHRLEELTIGKKLMRPAYKSVEPIKDYVEIDKRK